MRKFGKNRWFLLGDALVLLVCVGFFLAARTQKPYVATTFLMDTAVTQTVYGRNARQASDAVEHTLREMDARLSLYSETSETALLAQGAGSGEMIAINADTASLLMRAKELSAQSSGAFQLTIGPLSLAWGISGDSPRVPSSAEIDTLLPLVDDDMLVVEKNAARLCKKGQAIDLGGVAKGAACDRAKAIYEQYHIRSALFWAGGSSIYAHGTKPDGTLWRLGFRDPDGDGMSSLASFEICNAFFATSGGYERYFEQGGERFQHILDPQTGRPAETDIVSIGIMADSGIEADFWSTTLFVQGKEKALQYFASGGEGLFLDDTGNLYVSHSLKDSFAWSNAEQQRYQVIFL